MSDTSVNRLEPAAHRRSRGGFTLVELMLAAALTVVLVTILLRITTLASTTVTLSTQSISAFASARSAFDIMTRNLSQATLNSYLDYYDAEFNRRTNATFQAGTFVPVTYGRASDLQFLIQPNQVQKYYGQEVYFQVPRAYSTDATLQSVQGLLNACGYYVQYGDNSRYVPAAVSKVAAKNRYRLMQGLEPTEYLKIFEATAAMEGGGGTSGVNTSIWLSNIENGSTQGSAYVTPLGDNVILLLVWPRLSANDEAAQQAAGTYVPLSTDYTYNSQPTGAGMSGGNGVYAQTPNAEQLPPDVQVTMIVLDEASAAREAATVSGATPPADIEAALKSAPSLFQKSDTADYEADLSAVVTALAAKHLNFQLFNTTVAIRESKWSSQQ